MLLYSDRLRGARVPHAFSTRRAGHSAAPFDSLNFGNPSELPADQRDPASNIRRNFDLVARAIDPKRGSARKVVEVHQIHSGEVHVVREGSPLPEGPAPRADAIVTDDPWRLVAVRVADCAPVLLASRDGRVVGTVHAGWRGVIAGVAPAAVSAMRALGARDIIAAVGPCIGADSFEVGADVAELFTHTFGKGSGLASPAPERGAGKCLVDLKLGLRMQLESCGINEIDVLPHCTVRGADHFFSHRRDRAVTGRMIGIIGPRAD